VFHLLAHLATVERGEGSVLEEGARVGTISGALDTPHVHWECRSMLQPPAGVAVVEVCASPAAWLAGRWEPWDGRCPAVPVDDARTPRACRPGHRGPPPPPFPVPRPRSIVVVPSYEVDPHELRGLGV